MKLVKELWKLDPYLYYYDWLQEFRSNWKWQEGDKFPAGCNEDDYIYIIDYIYKHRPKHIVEYGSGWTTMLIDKVITNLDYGAEFISFEDNEYYYNIYNKYGFDVNNRINLVPAESGIIYMTHKKDLIGTFYVTYVHDFEKITDVDWVLIDGPQMNKYPHPTLTNYFPSGKPASTTLNLELLLKEFGGPMDVWIDGRQSTQNYYNNRGWEIVRDKYNNGIGTNLTLDGNRHGDIYK